MIGRPGRALLSLCIPVAAVAGWWVASAHSQSPYFPPLPAILTAFKQTWLFARVNSDVVPSLERYGIGLGFGVTLGIALGVAFGASRLLWQAFSPILDFLRSLPKAALLPLTMLALGIGNNQKIFFIAFTTIWPVLLSTADGIRGLNPTRHEAARAYRLPLGYRISHVYLPAASLHIFAGIRIAAAFGFVAMVVSEMVGSVNGIGYFTLQAQQSFAIRDMWAGVLLLGLLGIVVNMVFLILERWALGWHHRMMAASAGGTASRATASRRCRWQGLRADSRLSGGSRSMRVPD